MEEIGSQKNELGGKTSKGGVWGKNGRDMSLSKMHGL